MAGFGRSNSLSINTSGGSLFGNAAGGQGQQSAGLFGSSTNAQPKPQQTGGLFGSTSTAQTGGLFGAANTAATSQPPQSAGLFGNLNKPAATTATTGGLFGASATQSQPQQGASLFGGALGATPQAQPQTSQSGGLFGGLGQNQNQTQAQKPSLFGASAAQQSAGPSLFGNTQNQQQQNQPSLFGAQQNQPQPQNSLFGGMAQNKPLGGLGGSLNQPTNLGSSQMNDVSQLKSTSRINDLPAEIQRQIYAIDDLLQARIDKMTEVREAIPSHVNHLQTIAPSVAVVEKLLSTVELGLENDGTNIAHVKTLVAKDAEDATLSFRAIENQALPAQFRYRNASSTLSGSTAKPAPATSLGGDDADDVSKPVDLVSYFDRRTGDLSRTLDTYQRQIREIELHLRTMEAGTHEKAQQLMGTRNKALDDRQQLVEALRAIEAAIVDSAKKVGKVRDEVTKQTLGGVAAGLL